MAYMTMKKNTWKLCALALISVAAAKPRGVGGSLGSSSRGSGSATARGVATSPPATQTSPSSPKESGSLSADGEDSKSSPAIKALQELVLVWAVNQVRARIKGNAEFNSNTNNDVRLDDVLGCDEAKHELSQILEFIKHPQVQYIDNIGQFQSVCYLPYLVLFSFFNQSFALDNSDSTN